MELTKQHKIIIGICIAIIVAYLVLDVSRKSKMEETKLSTTENLNSESTSTVPQALIDALGPGNYTITPIPIEKNNTTPKTPVPSLSRAITFSSSTSFSPEVKEIITKNIITIQGALKKDPTDLSKWIDLGLYQKMIGDYDGAVISWKYVSQVADRDFISFGNLGNLYAYQLKDMGNAEKYYNQAIKNSPTQTYLYFQLAEAFRDVSKDNAKARSVVEQGLLANPNNPELLSLKASLD